MKYSVIFFLVLQVCILNAQPLNGSYTIGGSSPDFLTPQAAADALITNGVSGPVFMNIRPGIYMRDGGLSSVLVLDGNISGTSPINRITFQPDEAAGGNVNNVLFQIDQTNQLNTPSLVSIKTDNVTVRNLTFEDIDVMEAGANILFSIDQGNNPIAEDIVIEGCRFIGNSNAGGGAALGTDIGIAGSTNVTKIVIRQNTFIRLLRSVEIGGIAGSNGSVTVEDNQFLNAHHNGDASGIGILVRAYHTIVRRNYLDNVDGVGSLFGIVVNADSGLIEKNIIKNGGGVNGQVPTFRAIVVDKRLFSSNALSMLVANNMITQSYSVGGWGSPIMGRYGIIAKTKTQIIHNSIVHPYKAQISGGIFLDQGSDSSTVLNNIVMDYGSGEGLPIVEAVVVFKQYGGLSGVISDYNVFYYDYNQPGAVFLAAVGSNRYTSLSAYQTATGLDSNSISKDINFDPADYPHLSDCQAQDPELNGIPYPGIVDDIDGDLRSLTAPTRGADEGRLRTNPMFEDVFRTSLPGIALSIAFGKFDNLIADGLAVADYDNEQILLFHNMPSTRSFLQYGILNVGFKPTTLAFYDFDDDGELDLIVGGDSSLIKVYWGDGVGGFPESSEISTQGRTYHLVSEPYQLYDSLNVIFVAHPNAEPYYSSFIGVVMNLGERQLCYDYQHFGSEIDTIPWGPWSIVVEDIGGDSFVDIAGISPHGYFTSWEFMNVYNVYPGACDHNLYERWGSYHQINLVGGNYTYQNSIIPGDFDVDSDKDFVITGYSDNECNLLRNEGNFNFQPEPMAVNNGRGFAKLDYDNDDDLDFVSVNWALEDNGLTVFLNDGTGHFTPELNCYQSFASGIPRGVVSSDFDLDGKTDLAIIATDEFGHDSLFVLYNTGNVSGIREETIQQIPENFSLSQNYPNPFNPSTTIKYSIPRAGLVTIKIFDILGREVKTLVNEERQQGSYSASFNGSDVSSGVYFYQLKVANPESSSGQVIIQTRKMILLK